MYLNREETQTWVGIKSLYCRHVIILREGKEIRLAEKSQFGVLSLTYIHQPGITIRHDSSDLPMRQ